MHACIVSTCFKKMVWLGLACCTVMVSGFILKSINGKSNNNQQQLYSSHHKLVRPYIIYMLDLAFDAIKLLKCTYFVTILFGFHIKRADNTINIVKQKHSTTFGDNGDGNVFALVFVFKMKPKN